MGIRLGTALLLLWASGSVNAAPPPALRFCYEDVPQAPWTMPDGNGLNIELLRRVERRLNEQFVFLSMPWKRCIEEVRSGQVDAVVAAVDSPERRIEGELPKLHDGRADDSKALYTESYHVFLRANSGASWDGKAFVVPHGGIVIPKGYYLVSALRAQGYAVAEAVKSSEEGLRLLADGTEDVAILFGLESESVALSPRFKDKVIEAPPAYVTVPFYLLVSHQAYSQDPARAEAIWSAIHSVRASGEYRKLETSATRRDTRVAGRPARS
jgi:polar amino acid transport system substrate-binding protein